MSTYRDNLLKQLQDGKRSWSIHDVAGNDPDLFMVSVVEPLRDLCDEGVVADLEEHFGNYREGRLVDKVVVTGDVCLSDNE